MISDAAFGQYYPSSSILHKMDARAKIILIILLMVTIFWADSFAQFFFALGFVFVVVLLSRVPLSIILKSMKPIIFILVFTSVINIFFGGSGNVLWQLWFVRITDAGLVFAAKIAMRLLMLFLVASMLTLTTTPVELTDGIESLLKPLRIIRFPVHEFALIMSIALRMIPTLMEETDRIIRAQKSRGADFESGNIFRRAKALLPVLIPLLISSLGRADDLADAMEARCYAGAKGRTKMKKLRFGLADLIAVLICVAFLLLIIYLQPITSIIMANIGI